MRAVPQYSLHQDSSWLHFDGALLFFEGTCGGTGDVEEGRVSRAASCTRREPEGPRAGSAGSAGTGGCGKRKRRARGDDKALKEGQEEGKADCRWLHLGDPREHTEPRDLHSSRRRAHVLA